MNDKLFQITAGVGAQRGHLFAIRGLRATGKHSIWRMDPDFEVTYFPLSKPYFLSPENVVPPSLQVAKFAAYLRKQGKADKVHLWTPNGSGLPEMRTQRGWIGVDLDGTLAHYDRWRGEDHIGEPIGPMVERVRSWLHEGIDVRIFTARVSVRGNPDRNASAARNAVENWCKPLFGLELPVTNAKDFGMYELWDDRAVQVERNTGRVMPL